MYLRSAFEVLNNEGRPAASRIANDSLYEIPEQNEEEDI
jgi:hypothetical protein